MRIILPPWHHSNNLTSRWTRGWAPSSWWRFVSWWWPSCPAAGWRKRTGQRCPWSRLPGLCGGAQTTAYDGAFCSETGIWREGNKRHTDTCRSARWWKVCSPPWSSRWWASPGQLSLRSRSPWKHMRFYCFHHHTHTKRTSCDQCVPLDSHGEATPVFEVQVRGIPPGQDLVHTTVTAAHC